MAIVRRLEQVDLEIHAKHTDALGTFSIVRFEDGERCLQLDTYGSNVRKLKGKKSQSIRLAPTAVQQLREILDRYFPLTKTR